MYCTGVFNDTGPKKCEKSKLFRKVVSWGSFLDQKMLFFWQNPWNPASFNIIMFTAYVRNFLSLSIHICCVKNCPALNRCSSNFNVFLLSSGRKNSNWIMHEKTWNNILLNYSTYSTYWQSLKQIYKCQGLSLTAMWKTE